MTSVVIGSMRMMHQKKRQGEGLAVNPSHPVVAVAVLLCPGRVLRRPGLREVVLLR